MINKSYVWLKLTTILQGITVFFHILSFFNQPEPLNNSESQLFELMSNYKFDLGAGFHRSMNDLMNAFSTSFALLFLFSVLLNLFLLRNKIPDHIMKGMILINLLVYLACFIAMVFLTFLPPIIFTGLIVASLLIAYVKISKEKT